MATTMNTCAECGVRRASKVSPTGRPLCEQCFATLTGLAAAAGSIGSGNGSGAVGDAIGAASFAGAGAHEDARRAERRRRLAEASGFWRRLWIRLIG
ncbi:hypothetical protein IFT73_06940 [Aeromicrobium sp. CFBP 8757]|uniref:hypothetical protein n=1 Tax=Aeromicrobium sp. CFBP 8757 TaxID=2775288 RepID=UPI0017827C11|nr:hypothetical protein [Aeromicrobium sp. CFBP 8757]MBD8606587.1 hypothetical protein [Aeromicrobium sp. CFBP 8757]